MLSPICWKYGDGWLNWPHELFPQFCGPVTTDALQPYNNISLCVIVEKSEPSGPAQQFYMATEHDLMLIA